MNDNGRGIHFLEHDSSEAGTVTMTTFGWNTWMHARTWTTGSFSTFGLDAPVQMVATPVATKANGSAESSLVAGCRSRVRQTIHTPGQPRTSQYNGCRGAAVGTFEDSHLQVDPHCQCLSHGARRTTGRLRYFENCCASFVVDMMSYSGAPADVNALVDHSVPRWVHQGSGELLDRD